MKKLIVQWYPLFELANQLYGENVYAYYFDLPFEETLRRHKTKPNSHEFGEEAMRGWRREKDYSNYSLLTALSGFDTINAIDTRKALTEKSSLPKAFREKNIW